VEKHCSKANYVEKHCTNLKCLKKKNYKAKFLTISIIKKINSTKKILEKNMWKNTVAKQKLCGETL